MRCRHLLIGYARVGSVCSMDSVSVIEDHGGFQSINAAAHELGHGLVFLKIDK